jgi:hypothetical protein
MEALTRATFKQKEVDNIPKGAKIISKDVSITVEEIENGFLVSKSTEIKYEFDKRTDYSYITKKFYAKENPLEIDMEGLDDKTLASNFLEEKESKKEKKEESLANKFE